MFQARARIVARDASSLTKHPRRLDGIQQRVPRKAQFVMWIHSICAVETMWAAAILSNEPLILSCLLFGQ